MKKFQAKLVFIIALIFALIMLITPTTQAGNQSIGTGSAASNRVDNWIKIIRQMEGENQGMGLNETIDTTTLLATTEPNNIDVHLLKNTEYGATILLGASDYGKQGSSITGRCMDQGSTSMDATVQASTTGNVSGVYEMGYYNMSTSNRNKAEWVAATNRSDKKSSFVKAINDRYFNWYASTDSIEDYEMKKWHNSRLSSGGYTQELISRGNSGAFSYDTGISFENLYARPAIISGTGL